jgi:penicillin amidase
MVYADVDGNIGFIAAGRVPIRGPDNDLSGMAPAPGWDARYDWQGFIPFEELPQAYNPEAGRVVTANQKITPPDYKYFVSSSWELPYRSGRIGELLAAQPKHSRQSFATMQHDRRSGMARDLLPLMMKGVPANAPSGSVASMLARWDGDMDATRPEPLLFHAWYRELTRLVYADELGPDLFRDYWERRPQFMLNVLNNKDGQARWCDDVTTPAVETCDTQIAAALERAVAMLKASYGDDPAKWRWGDAHYSHSRHQPFAKNKWLSRIFDIFEPADGDSFTVNVGSNRIADEEFPFQSTHAPSLRAIYDLAAPDQSQFIHSTGQSGNRLSPFYASFAGPWARGEYVPMTTKRVEVEAGAIGTLQLQPQAK